MSVTVNYQTEARIEIDYENDEGEQCSFNCLEMDITISRLAEILNGLGVEGSFDDVVSIDPLKVIKAIQMWDGSPVVGGICAHTKPTITYRLIAKIGMIATACHLKGIPFVAA